MTGNGLSVREREQIEIATGHAERGMEEVDVQLAKITPDVWFTAALCREYFNALKHEFKDGEYPILNDDQLIKILVGTINQVRR